MLKPAGSEIPAQPQSPASASMAVNRALSLAIGLACASAMRSPWSGIGRVAGRRRAELDRCTLRQEWFAARVRRTEWPIRSSRLRRRFVLLLRLPRLIKLGHRQRTGIVPARVTHQRVDPLVHRRMGIEQILEPLARIVDAHLHHARGRPFELAAILDLTQR